VTVEAEPVGPDARRTELAGVPMSGDRVQLERLAPHHLATLHRISISPEVSPHWPLLGDAVAEEQLWDHLWGQSSLQFAIVRTDTAESVGLVQGVEEDMRSRTIGLGLVVDPALWRAGWPLEGVVLFLDYLFTGLGYRKVYANLPASVLDRVGDGALGVYLTHEATFNQHLKVGDGYEDVCVLSLCRDDWPARRPDEGPATTWFPRLADRARGDASGQVTFEEFVREVASLAYLALPEAVTPDIGLVDELELDSLGALELLVVVEDLARSVEPPVDPPVIATLGDLYGYFVRLRATHV
jgi:RimJ/RimL family protein N-acetyltransferase/acyl carrier protein